MNITVKVDDLTLETAVGQVIGYDNESGEPYSMGDRTLADIVAAQIVDRAVKREDWYDFIRTVADVKREAIREAVRPTIEKAIAEPLTKTSAYGDPIGGTTTLREVIVDEARKLLDRKVDNYPAHSNQTVLQKVVAEEIQAAFAAEIKDAVAKARASVADEIGKQVASAVAAAMRGR